MISSETVSTVVRTIAENFPVLKIILFGSCVAEHPTPADHDVITARQTLALPADGPTDIPCSQAQQAVEKEALCVAEKAVSMAREHVATGAGRNE